MPIPRASINCELQTVVHGIRHALQDWAMDFVFRLPTHDAKLLKRALPLRKVREVSFRLASQQFRGLSDIKVLLGQTTPKRKSVEQLLPT
jgi:hypothetical protein